ncbi:VanZ family protein [Cohnella sp. GCM10027633]|uniref:VanZ family protein n=1 Tax=unclassified Cohnella TaxID=2636738 RepID=UPI003626C796
MKHSVSMKDAAVWTLLAIYAWIIVKVVLFKMHPADPRLLWQQLMFSLDNPRFVAWRIEHGNLVPFHEISAALAERTEHRMLNFIGNIAVFIPFGMLLPGAFGSDRLALTRATTIAFAFSLVLEGSQAVLAIGSFDVDDLILNAFGGWIGCILIVGARRLYRLLTRRSHTSASPTI